MKILSRKDTASKVNYSIAQLDRMESAGEFPKRVRLGPAKVGWVETEVDDWIASRIRERDVVDA